MGATRRRTGCLGIGTRAPIRCTVPRHSLTFFPRVSGAAIDRQEAAPGNIIIRQRGTKFHSADDGSVGIGRDHTIFANVSGRVKFNWDVARKRFTVSVEPSAVAQSSEDAASFA